MNLDTKIKKIENILSIQTADNDLSTLVLVVCEKEGRLYHYETSKEVTGEERGRAGIIIYLQNNEPVYISKA